MLKKLRLRLTLLATVLTGGVLLIMTLIALSISEKGLQTSSENAFQSNLNSIIVKLQNDQVVANSWLAQMESSEELIISISDSDSPLQFRGSWSPRTDRAILIERAQEAGKSAGIDVHIPPFSVLEASSVTVSIKGDNGDNYLGAVAVIPSHGGWQGLTLLKDMSALSWSLTVQRLSFGALVLLGIVLLWFLCWYFTGKALRPIQENARRQNEFIAAASHELRSPLTVIRTSASALNPGESQSPQLIANIEKECARMARLIDDLLILAGSDAKTWSIRTETVDLDTLLLETAELFYPLAQQKGMALCLRVPDETLPLIHGDEQRLKQILTILLDNAFSYTPANGTVTLKAETEGKLVEISVSDTGPGIPSKHLTHIFDRFYRGDASRKDKNHFGLGLSIAWELAALHQGKLYVKQTDSTGTTFTLRLPAPYRKAEK
ncbi:sensor histidine kinase [Fumia xinanensis]|uniref:histidine kinase n=1 Tax=Fumia xinanensis TaxID=2763659 RepID=A0A926E1U9_9FIRM|nr:HAMP domain-containing sensor histidine kinase [Fumia xinanensis]MBC8559761.1 HAMP domain-containing histidine kinase [Fumia xinanensis]PWL41238.1 MAG: sensor histidine kinase [Clostridiales bacterium]